MLNATRRYGYIALALGAGGGACFVIVVSAYAYNFWTASISGLPEDWGRFGEYVGGLAGTLLSAITLAALAVNLYLQSIELSEARQRAVEERNNARADRRQAEQALYDQRRYEERRIHPLVITDWQFMVDPKKEVPREIVFFVMNVGLGPCILRLIEFLFDNDIVATYSLEGAEREPAQLQEAIKRTFANVVLSSFTVEMHPSGWQRRALARGDQLEIARVHLNTSDSSVPPLALKRLQRKLLPTVHFQNLIGMELSTETQYVVLRERIQTEPASGQPT